MDETKLYVEATVYVPNLDASEDIKSTTFGQTKPPSSQAQTLADTCTVRTKVISGNAYNPYWNEPLRLSFELYPEFLDLAFLRVEVKQQITMGEDLSVAHFCASLGSLEQGQSPALGCMNT